MESQVHIKELESKLEKERCRLGELRKIHYKLASDSEGWEQEVNIFMMKLLKPVFLVLFGLTFILLIGCS